MSQIDSETDLSLDSGLGPALRQAWEHDRKAIHRSVDDCSRGDRTHLEHVSFSGKTTRCSAGGSFRTCAGGGTGFVLTIKGREDAIPAVVGTVGEVGLVTGQNMDSEGILCAAGVTL